MKDYRFYLSYAGIDADVFLNKFWRDLGKVMTERSTRERTYAGTLGKPAPAGESAGGVPEELRASHALICLLSPAYFKSEQCWAERRAFAERAAPEWAGGALPASAPILPVLWVPCAGAAEALPGVEFEPREFGAVYASEGLRFLLALQSRYKEDYVKFLSAFAERLERALERSPLAGAPREAVVAGVAAAPLPAVVSGLRAEAARPVAAAPREERAARPYRFFLSYSRKDRNDDPKNFLRFYNNLLAEVRRRLGETVEGFYDHQSIRVGQEWDPKIIAALNSTEVFIPVYSPFFFRSEYCGKEWEIIRLRQQAYMEERGTDERPPVILPVLWIPEDDGNLPAVTSSVQYSHDLFGDDYARNGLYDIIRYQRRTSRINFYKHMALRINEVAQSYALPRLADCPSLRDVPNAFAVTGGRRDG